MNKKIPAFTLIEIIIVLLLSMMLIGIVLLGYRNFEQYRGVHKRNSQNLSEVLLMHTRLLNYFEKATSITSDIEEGRIVFADTAVFASCRIQENDIVFQHLQAKDTVRIKVSNLAIEVVQNTKLINHLFFVIGEKEKRIEFVYNKDYGKALLFNVKEIRDEY